MAPDKSDIALATSDRHPAVYVPRDTVLSPYCEDK